MADPFKRLYDDIALRKDEANNAGPYTGGNGRIDRAVDLIRNEEFPRSGVLLDVGGATGNLGYALRDLFETTVVIDIADACRIPAEDKGNTFLDWNVDNQGLPDEYDGRIDLITALDFIEHVLDPEKFARECFRVLRSGGKALVNTPNIQFWRHLHSLVVDGVFPHTSGDREVYHGGHVAFYNFFDMKRIFTAVGFVEPVMHTRGLEPDPPPPIWMHVGSFSDKGKHLAYADLIFSCRKP